MTSTCRENAASSIISESTVNHRIYLVVVSFAVLENVLTLYSISDDIEKQKYFLFPTHELRAGGGGGGYWRRLRLSAFRFWSRSLKPIGGSLSHTYPVGGGGIDVPFGIHKH